MKRIPNTGLTVAMIDALTGGALTKAMNPLPPKQVTQFDVEAKAAAELKRERRLKRNLKRISGRINPMLLVALAFLTAGLALLLLIIAFPVGRL